MVICDGYINSKTKWKCVIQYELWYFLFQVDITYYPYDKQKCTIEVVSWGYNYNEIKLEHLVSEINLQDYVYVVYYLKLL